MNKIAKDYITESNGKYIVHGHNGRHFGTYSSKGEAEKRLEQIEYFKHAKDFFTSEDMEPGEMDQLRKLFGKFIGEEEKEPVHQAKDVNPIAGGVICQAPSGKVLLLKRVASEKNYGGHWSLPGGKAEDGEGPEDAAGRECMEETGYSPNTLKEVNLVNTPNGFAFSTFLHKCKEEFTPEFKDGEHDDHQWASLDSLPEPIHPGVKETLMKLKGSAHDALAFDKDSVRSLDDAGRMHVASAHISKACINPYYGHEIPGFEVLGLDPEKVYQLFRDPVELEKAAESFNGIQLLIKHIPVSVDDHQPDSIVGTTGTTANFNAPYLDNELIVWTKEGIDLIESGLQQELSCGYGYDPVMEPGNFEGEHYDGRMTNIKGNHVALVSKGRAGPDVVVGDEALKQKDTVKMKPLSRTGARLHAALSAFMAPKIALDAQLKCSTALGTALSQIGATDKITRASLKNANFRKAIVKMAKDTVEPMMTPEAKKTGFGPDDVIMKVLDMVEGQAAAEPAELDTKEGGEESAPAGEGEWKKGMMDAMMKSGLDEAACKTIMDMIPSMETGDAETPEEKAKKEKEAKDAAEKEAADKEAKDAETPEAKMKAEEAKKAEDKKTMDAAIKQAEDNTMKSLQAIRVAERAVLPLIGEIALDSNISADEIYKSALKHVGVKTDGIHASAFPALVEMAVQKKAADAKPTHLRIVHDSSLDDDRKAFDEANGIVSRHVRNLGA